MMSRRTVIFAMGGMATFGFTTQLQARVRPLVMRMVGTFQPFDQKAADNAHTLTLSYKRHQWLFLVEDADIMGASSSGKMLLSRITPPRLSLAGSAKLLEPLKSPENMGKRFTLEGLFYPQHRSFHVSSVKEEALPGLEKQEERQ